MIGTVSQVSDVAHGPIVDLSISLLFFSTCNLLFIFIVKQNDYNILVCTKSSKHSLEPLNVDTYYMKNISY